MPRCNTVLTPRISTENPKGSKMTPSFTTGHCLTLMKKFHFNLSDPFLATSSKHGTFASPVPTLRHGAGPSSMYLHLCYQTP